MRILPTTRLVWPVGLDKWKTPFSSRLSLEVLSCGVNRQCGENLDERERDGNKNCRLLEFVTETGSLLF